MTETAEKTNIFLVGVLNYCLKTLTGSGLEAITQSIEELKQLVQSSNGSVKSVQRGVTTNATMVTITAVDMDKTVVLSISKGSAGYVAARGNIHLQRDVAGNASKAPTAGKDQFAAALPDYNGSISGGSTDLTTKQYSAKLISATQLQTDGLVEWQVIEYA